MFCRWIQKKNQGIRNPSNLAYKRTFLETKEEFMSRKKPKKRVHWKKLQKFRKYSKFAEQKPECLCLFCTSYEVCSLQGLLATLEYNLRKAKAIHKMNDNKETLDLLVKVQIQLHKVHSKIVLCLKNKLYQSICTGLPTIKYRTTSQPRKKQPIQNDPSPFPTIKDLEERLLISDDEIAFII